MRILKKKYWPAMVETKISSYNEKVFAPMNEWCLENLGKGNYYVIDKRWDTSSTFYFKSEQDATFFTLKWVN